MDRTTLSLTKASEVTPASAGSRAVTSSGSLETWWAFFPCSPMGSNPWHNDRDSVPLASAGAGLVGSNRPYRLTYGIMRPTIPGWG